MFELLSKSETAGVQFVALPNEALLEVWRTYQKLGPEERFAMFKILTGSAVYALGDSIITAQFMVGLLTDGLAGFEMAVSRFVTEHDPGAEVPILTDEDIERLLNG